MDLIAAHRCSSRRCAQLERSSQGRCVCCLSAFAPAQVVEWTDAGTPALCPRCGLDAVIGNASGLPLDTPFFEQMREH